MENSHLQGGAHGSHRIRLAGIAGTVVAAAPALEAGSLSVATGEWADGTERVIPTAFVETSITRSSAAPQHDFPMVLNQISAVTGTWEESD